jgi:hypothetical protein
VTALPSYADIPPAGQAILRGRPVLTFFTEGQSPSVCESRLQQRADELDYWLYRR